MRCEDEDARISTGRGPDVAAMTNMCTAVCAKSLTCTGEPATDLRMKRTSKFKTVRLCGAAKMDSGSDFLFLRFYIVL